MHAAAVIAMGFDYPRPGSIEELTAAIESSTSGTIKRHMSRFVEEVEALPFSQWEELHTKTLDLSPLFVPYVGHVVWGDNYRRGEFMADLNSAMRMAGVDLDGELPDHIAAVLRYLSTDVEPRTDLIQELPGAVDSMTRTLAKAASDNPYRHLLAATSEFAGQFPVTARPIGTLTHFRLGRNGNGKATWSEVG